MRRSAAMAALCLAAALLCSCSGSVSEAGVWQLELAADSEGTPLDGYDGTQLTLDGASYVIELDGDTLYSGAYTAEEVDGGTLALLGAGGEVIGACGTVEYGDGSSELSVTMDVGGMIWYFLK